MSNPYFERFITYIVNPVIVFLFALALLYFAYGVLVFLINADEESKRETGKKHMLWGVVGLFIMVAVYGIIGVILGTIGAQAPANIINKI